MPELPDIVVYLQALESRILDQRLLQIRLNTPFLLRTVAPAPGELEGKRVRGVGRLGKRIVLSLEDDLFLVLHLMVAGRLHWRPVGARLGGKVSLAAFDFERGTLVLTEAGTKRRAALYLVRGEGGLQEHERGGLEVLEADSEEFHAALTGENHTLKRALTDPRLISGIGNAYSDEILHRARLSPLQLTQRLTRDEVRRVHEAARAVLREWIVRLERAAGGGFPENVTAFRAEMSVHGRYGQACPVCGAPVQRIVYAENECNYCAGCQTGGRLLADRALSRLLRDDWPRTLAELEEKRAV